MISSSLQLTVSYNYRVIDLSTETLFEKKYMLNPEVNLTKAIRDSTCAITSSFRQTTGLGCLRLFAEIVRARSFRWVWIVPTYIYIYRYPN